jgi:hypothetical protein
VPSSFHRLFTPHVNRIEPRDCRTSGSGKAPILLVWGSGGLNASARAPLQATPASTPHPVSHCTLTASYRNLSASAKVPLRATPASALQKVHRLQPRCRHGQPRPPPSAPAHTSGMPFTQNSNCP